MSLSPLLSAPPVVFWHAVAALCALGLGAWQLAGPKGVRSHRIAGWAWVVLMLTVAVSSFGIHGIDRSGGYSAIHLLSVLTLVTTPFGVIAARRHQVRRHGRVMTALFVSALVGAGLFTLLPGRIMGAVVFGW